ncbi:hypothetical protein EBL_c17590 [Shimwellia blattae DSM 4481 = NBRC 105725]|uniref:Uncharacterized protein n=1 Tax=Shimwellia blattae (strain ATCC 29907 / DSM 4481 / JCM 1650 / NBRC 105725 / CDC 9005-74) TaxID=630626 RepID=I2B8J9_SHIBC|nr:hypothetical protein EBL_c17590 [Shimwellia blattae DSM 4481 = NBRC 105725]GAB82995.1 hypothetical protein EB105725_38_00410 [Shimwellia blattae DSM 4481 = NBRC 105725]
MNQPPKGLESIQITKIELLFNPGFILDTEKIIFVMQFRNLSNKNEEFCNNERCKGCVLQRHVNLYMWGKSLC